MAGIQFLNDRIVHSKDITREIEVEVEYDFCKVGLFESQYNEQLHLALQL